MKIYSKNGDQGETDLCGGRRVRKDSPRMEVCGTIDELNSTLGAALAGAGSDAIDEGIAAVVERIQAELFTFGAELADGDAAATGNNRISGRHIAALEADIDRFTAALEPLAEFILPRGTMPAAHLHVARTVCRRAERRLVTLMHAPDEKASPMLLAYLNRLGDLLFVLARAANAAKGQPDRETKPFP